MTPLSKDLLLKHLTELFDCLAFELYEQKSDTDTADYAIPYMMNDALECYLLLKNAALTGEFLPDCKESSYAQIIQENDRNALIIHQGANHVFTIWFESAWKILNCYQYHTIGHFWVKGQEQWRQLVYMIGTMYDKYDYLGTDVCNKLEMELLPLMNFAPFRMWSPIHESLDERYPESSDGAFLMYQLALEAKCPKFARLVKLYWHVPSRILAKHLGNMLTKAGMEKLYELIYHKVASASLPYSIRDYGHELNEQIKKNRSDVTNHLHQNGFVGDYPFFSKDTLQIVAVEEHPFTIMDMEFKNFDFRIQLMVSDCKDGCLKPNAGFFCHPKRTCKIISDLSQL